MLMKLFKTIGFVFALIIAIPALPQSAKILYISPDYRTGPVYDKLRSDISAGLRTCLQEKWVREISNTTWERSSAKSSLLNNLRVDYVLKLDQLDVIKPTDKQVQVSFELIYVDDTYTPASLTWNNSVYVIELNDRQEPANLKKVVNDVCEEIDFYLISSDNPLARKFRPRVKIGEFELSSEDIEDIDFNEFRKWLSKILEDKYSVEPNPNYVFYFSRKYDKQYPDNSIYQISGKFYKYKEADDNLVRVQLTIEFPDAHDVNPLSVINSEEFKFDEKIKEELVSNIISVLEKEINYYGQE
jgi:hypothetical protein